MQGCEVINPQLLRRNNKVLNSKRHLKEANVISSQWSPKSTSNEINSIFKNEDSSKVNRDWPTIMSTTSFDILPFEIPKYLQESDILSLDQNLV